MDNKIPPLVTINIGYVVQNIQRISNDFTKRLDLPGQLIEVVFNHYIKSNKHVTEKEIKYFLSHEAQITAIDFSGSFNFNDLWLDYLPTNLLYLDLGHCKGLSNAGLQRIIERFPLLQALKLNGCFRIEEDTCSSLSKLVHLQILEASETQFDDKALTAVIQACPKLRGLNLSNTRVFKSIDDIGQLTQLTELNLEGTRIWPQAVKKILQNLTNLKIFKTNFYADPAFNSCLNELPSSLETLKLDLLVDNDYRQVLSHLTGLTELNMHCWEDGSVFSIDNMKQLTKIRIEGKIDNNTNEYDWSNVKELNVLEITPPVMLTNLTGLEKIAGMPIKEEDYLFLSNLTNLTSIGTDSLAENNHPVLSTLRNLKSLSIMEAKSYELNELDLIELEVIDLDTCEHLTKLTSLEKLRIANLEDPALTLDLSQFFPNLTSLDCSMFPMELIARLTNLESLDVRNNEDSHIEHLSTLTRLTYLDVGGIGCTPEVFSELMQHLTNLKSLLLFIASEEILASLDCLSNLKQLQDIKLSDPPPARIYTVLSQLPALKSLSLFFDYPPEESFLALLNSPSLASIHARDIPQNIRQAFSASGIHMFDG